MRTAPCLYSVATSCGVLHRSGETQPRRHNICTRSICRAHSTGPWRYRPLKSTSTLHKIYSGIPRIFRSSVDASLTLLWTPSCLEAVFSLPSIRVLTPTQTHATKCADGFPTLVDICQSFSRLSEQSGITCACLPQDTFHQTAARDPTGLLLFVPTPRTSVMHLKKAPGCNAARGFDPTSPCKRYVITAPAVRPQMHAMRSAGWWHSPNPDPQQSSSPAGH